MKQIKVAMCGAHSTGKTTAVRALADQMEKRFPEIKVAVVTEVARGCPWPVNENSTAEAQRWIFHRQIAGELEAVATGARVVICDRSVLDNLAYAFVRWNSVDGQGPWDWLPSYLSLFSESWLTSYSRIWFFSPSGEPVCDDGFRSTSRAFQMRVHDQINKLLYFAHDGKQMRAFDWPGLEKAFAYMSGEIEKLGMAVNP